MTQAGPNLRRAVRGYVHAYASLHGRRKAAEDLGVSRHTLWRFLEQGHMGRAVPSAVLRSLGKSIQAIEAATFEIIIDLEGLRPDPALRVLRQGLEEALLLLCATPLATVEELSRFGRVPASTLRDRLKKLTERGLADSVPHHLSVLGTRPKRRYFPTEKGVTAAGAATKGRNHMLRSYPVSRQWFRLLAERLDAVAVLHRVAAMVADADLHDDPVLRPGRQEREVRLLRLPVPPQAGQWHLRRPQAQRPPLRGAGRREDSGERAYRVQHQGVGEDGGRGDGRGGQGAAA